MHRPGEVPVARNVPLWYAFTINPDSGGKAILNRQPEPPIHARLLTAGPDRAQREAALADALAAIGPAFEGIQNYNSAGRYEDLQDAVRRFTKQNRVPLTLDVLVALAQRINELSSIVEQTALTADDLPTAGWGIPAGPQEPKESQGTDELSNVEIVNAVSLRAGDTLACGATVAKVGREPDGDGFEWVRVTYESGRVHCFRPDHEVKVLVVPDPEMVEHELAAVGTADHLFDGPEEYAASAAPGDPDTTDGGF